MDNVTHRITELAFELADNAARSDIECMCEQVGSPRTIEAFITCFYDLGRIPDPEDAPYVAKAVEYLDARGLLKRHPSNENWVRPQSGEQQ